MMTLKHLPAVSALVQKTSEQGADLRPSDDLAEDMTLPSYAALTASNYEQQLRFKKKPVTLPIATSVVPQVEQSDDAEDFSMETSVSVTKETPKEEKVMAGV